MRKAVGEEKWRIGKVRDGNAHAAPKATPAAAAGHEADASAQHVHVFPAVAGPPLTACYSSTAIASISMRKPGSASDATPIQVAAGFAGPAKDSLRAPPTASAFPGP
jgi:hypothetical protein